MNPFSAILRRFATALLLLTLLLAGPVVHAQTLKGSGDVSAPSAIPAPPAGDVNGAAFVSQSAPTTMIANGVYNVSVTMRNTGSNEWSDSLNYRLGSLTPHNNMTWGIGRVMLGSSVVPYWGVQTFSFAVTAPSAPGTYTFNWGMLQEGFEWFGTSAPVTITVAAPAPVNNAQVVAMSAPATMVSGQDYPVSVTMKNTGTTTWTAPNYKLGAQNPADNYLWNSPRVSLPTSVAPGQQVQFNFPVVAPAAGNYSMQFRMVQEYVEWFGGTASAPVTVKPATPAPTISVTRPSSLVSGRAFSTTWSTTSATSVTQVCTAAGTGYVANESLAVSGTRSQTAQAAWINYPSSCTWTATGAGGSATYTQTLTTTAPSPLPVISVTCPSSLVAGQSFTTTWISSNATSVTQMCTAAGTGYVASEVLAVTGTRSQVAQSAWVGYPSSCTWTATGAGGSATYSQTLTTAAPPPLPTISVTRPSALTAGQAFTTTWSTTNATSVSQVCTAAGTGYVANEALAVSGTRSQVAQSAWVNYPSSCTWTASGAGGTATYKQTLTTVGPSSLPTISVTRPAGLVAGQAFSTTWSTTNATSVTQVCTAAGTGYVANEALAVSGSRSQVAQATWVNYSSSCIWTASGAGGTATYSQTLTTTAAALPTISVQRSPATMTSGQAFTLTWSTANATSLTRVCTASGTGFTGNDALATSGSSSGTASSAWVSYPSTCTWTATGLGGTANFAETMTTLATVNGNVTYIHTDGLGSPVARTDGSGTVISRTRYEPYGYVASGVTPTIGFTGHANDSDTGLTYMQQRYYDPVAGRFLSIDPVTTDAKTGGSFNRYAYGSNSPYRYIDLDGRQATLAWCFGGPVGCAFGVGLTGVTIIIGTKTIRDTSHIVQNNGNGSGSNNTSTAPPAVAPGSTPTTTPTSPIIDPQTVGGKSPADIDKLAGQLGLQPKGPDPQGGRGAYVDPVTGEQRILVHPGPGGKGGHSHVNNPQGARLDIDGKKVSPESPDAHLPLNNP